MPHENAAPFNEWARKGAGPKMEDAHAHTGRKVLDRLTIGYDEAFIDLGCGTGWAARYVAEKVPTIGLCVGVDVSEELIKQARALSAGKLPVKFLVAPFEDVPFGDASFHHAFSMEALYYAKVPLAAAQSAWRLLKPGGSFHFVTDFYRENPLSRGWQDDIPLKMHYLGVAEWVALFKAAGFVDVATERVLDDRPIPEGMAFPWGGFKTREDLARFRTQIGSLYVRGRKGEGSHGLDAYIDRAVESMAEEEAAPPAPGGGQGGETQKRRGFAGRRKGGK